MRCSATANRTGKQCAKHASKGATVCRSHGGAAPQVRNAAAVRVAEAEALAALASMKVVPVDDPLQELALLAGEALQWKAFLKARVGELSSLGYAGATGEQVRAAVALYAAALDRLERVLTSIARLRIDERRIRISERQAEIVLSAIDAGLAAADLDHTTRHVVRTTAGRHLSLVRDAA